MRGFLNSFPLDGLSFWVGFLAASLCWWLLLKLRPYLSDITEALRAHSRAARLLLTASTEARYRSGILHQAQRSHLAAPLFALDKILVPPRLLDPPPPLEHGAAQLHGDITDQTLPYLPDWPDLASAYCARTLSFEEALRGSANLVITGWPGSGKTVALAHLASQIARQDAQIGTLSSRVPFLIHSADLSRSLRPEGDPLDGLIEAAGQKGPASILSRLPNFLRAAVEEGRALLLLDGLDELPPDLFREVCSFLGRLTHKHPSLQVVTAANPDFYDGLAALGFLPVSIAGWDDRKRHSLIVQWIERWEQSVQTADGPENPVDPLLLKEWLLNDPAILTPMELTLKIWAALAGDTLGNSVPQALEAYLQRMAAGIPGARPVLERMAGQMALSGRPAVSPGELDGPGFTNPSGTSILVENGLLRSGGGGHLGFAHPVIGGYLAACELRNEKIDDLNRRLADRTDGQEWIGRSLALEYLTCSAGDAGLLARYLGQDHEPLHQKLLTAARWLHSAPDTLAWRETVLRKLANLLQKDASPVALRARALAALAASDSPGVIQLLRQLLSGRDAALCQLALLGIGYLKESKAVHDLSEHLFDPSPIVRRAACLALVRLGGKTALDAVSEALLHGDEDLRRAAAEALANDPEEGYPILKEGSRIDDLLVRRAVIYGLQRVHEAWAGEILEKMQTEDAQWVVKSAASQAIEENSQREARLPRPLPSLTQIPWLIAFAGERGMGVAPGKAAVDLLLLAMREGSEGQRLAALDTAGRIAEARAVPIIKQIYELEKGDLREEAFTALWRMAAAGIDL